MPGEVNLCDERQQVNFSSLIGPCSNYSPDGIGAELKNLNFYISFQESNIVHLNNFY